jgi:thiamine biosynthesis lipoprotein
MIGIALLIVLLTAAPLKGEGARVERTVYAMGTRLSIAVEATDRAAAVAAGERAVRAVEAAEERLSTWRSDSELSRLNGAPAGRRFRLSERLAEDLETARWCWAATAGAFDPTIGALGRAWGLREGGRSPSPSELDRALAATGMEGLALRHGTAVRRRGDLVLEEGGFGKGAGLDDALDALAGDPRVTGAELDFGGQAAMLGAGVAWRLTVADPRDRERPAFAVAVEGTRPSVATSGNSERGVVVAGRRHGHVLDPRTGRPAPDFGSLTVWTEGAARADCLSTGLYVLGPAQGLARAARLPGVEALALEVGAGGRLTARATAGLAGRLQALVDGVAVEIVEADFSSQEGSMSSP